MDWLQSLLWDHNPQLYSLPTNEMITSGHIERLFHNESITFDAQAMKIRIR